ncbi:tyrosine-type recombinase/integrase [Bradyrhizobium sp. Pa8]|uniref:tyrosine-type recombinase/integrase n=1 Tax=Bradyrhizobium sp. Pa8 TaxID=3386552 RepID=UPI00403F88A1
MIGLIAATGLRISEAIKLRCRDVDVMACRATARMTKFFKSHYVPFYELQLALEVTISIVARKCFTLQM